MIRHVMLTPMGGKRVSRVDVILSKVAGFAEDCSFLLIANGKNDLANKPNRASSGGFDIGGLDGYGHPAS